ncbi:SH3 domain-containing protein [Prosthecodimorpha staleyi]|uniref:SH3 domain-containing protein n=1 Tax=Prosthecodimorpha staleyi TaxID=2840188 RepID=A0A947GDS9_9HYPH|nr:SH3 domain-containing protein [Prosthecodimorpha staleyi]MBT9288590.1 SH3 domain-containing protein [Prosthecodimorpha staleyi]
MDWGWLRALCAIGLVAGLASALQTADPPPPRAAETELSGFDWSTVEVDPDYVPGPWRMAHRPVAVATAERRPAAAENDGGGRQGAHSVTADRVALRTAPSLRGQVLLRFDRGAEVMVLRRRGTWAFVQEAGGTRQGWIFGRYLGPTRDGSEDADPTAEAKADS